MPDNVFAFAHHFMRIAYFHRKTVYLFWTVELMAFVFFTLLDGYALFFNHASLRNASYHDIRVEIRQHRVYGKLNQSVSIKQRNNHCVQAHCGFPADGHYFLDELQFITIHGKDYIKKMCVKNSACYQNLFDEQIERYLVQLRQHKITQIREMLWVFVWLNMLFYPVMLYALERRRKEEEMHTFMDHQAKHQIEIML